MLCIFFKYITLVPLLDFISLMQLLWVFVSVERWTCKWYFALSLLSCMSRWSFLVWMKIVVTIYSDCSFLVKSCFITLIYITWSHCACSICITSFLHTMIVLYCCFFRRYLFLWFKSYTYSRVRCEWVLPLFQNSRLSLEFVIGCFVTK